MNNEVSCVEVMDDGSVLVTPTLSEYNVDVLEIGKKYSYKQLCELLSMKYTTGEAKTKQLSQLSHYIKYTKQGTKYLIEAIHNPPLPIQAQFPSYSKYVNEMVDMMLVYLFNKQSEEVILNFNELYEICGLVNKKYLFYFKQKNLLAEQNHLNSKDIDDFYFTSASFAKSLIKSTLNAMSARKIIKYYVYYDIVIAQGQLSPLHKKADDDDLKEILLLERDALKHFNFKTIGEANATLEKRNQYYNYYNSLLRKRHPEWLQVTKAYKVIAPMKIIIDEIASSNARKTLNEKVYNYLKEHADRSYIKYNGFLGYSKEWQDAQHKLCDLLVLL